MTLSDSLSILAFLVSGVSLVISLEQRIHDRHKLMCKSSIVTTLGTGRETYQICVEITNTGRRPISVIEIYYEEDNKDRPYPIRSPIFGGEPTKKSSFELAENQTKQFSSSEITRKQMLQKGKQLTVEVIDSTNKAYTMLLDNDAFEFSSDILKKSDEQSD